VHRRRRRSQGHITIGAILEVTDVGSWQRGDIVAVSMIAVEGRSARTGHDPRTAGPGSAEFGRRGGGAHSPRCIRGSLRIIGTGEGWLGGPFWGLP